MSDVRLAVQSDLSGLLNLFEASEVSQFAQPMERARQVWDRTLESESSFIFVAEVGGTIAATCMLITAPNLLRQGRSHGFLENVMTHPNFRGRGLGKAVVSKAINHAWAVDCHHVLMQSGRADPKVHRFYEQMGFKPGLRVGYVVTRAPE
jgi:GNAT superfamily N-acetyltransferase